MTSISKIALRYIFFGVILLLSEHIIVINYFSLLLVALSTIYAYFSGNYKCSLFLILLFSAISLDGVNVYTFSLSGLSLFYIVSLILFVLVLVDGCNRVSKSYLISKPLFIYIFFVFFNLFFSTLNLIDSQIYFLKDFIIIVFLPLLFYLLFKKISNKDILFVFYCLVVVKIIVSFILYITGLTLRYDENLHGAMVVDNADELSAFYTIFLLAITLFVKHKNKVYFYIVFSVTCIAVYYYGLGFLGLGSQVVLMLLLVLLVYICKRKLIFLLLVPCVFLLYPLIDVSNNELLVHKLDNIIGLISNLNRDSIYLIPHSPQVRVIELINIFNYSWYNVLFGHGLGGYFTDQYFAFNQYIGKFDFSDYEISTRRFYNPHNIAFGLLKMGIFWWFFIAYLFYIALKVKDNETKIFLLVASFVLFLNFGYAIKTSIILALVFIVIRNHQRASICEKEN